MYLKKQKQNCDFGAPFVCTPNRGVTYVACPLERDMLIMFTVVSAWRRLYIEHISDDIFNS